MRDAVAAEPGYMFVRADLGQIEPRVLAAISGDRQFAAALVERFDFLVQPGVEEDRVAVRGQLRRDLRLDLLQRGAGV